MFPENGQSRMKINTRDFTCFSFQAKLKQQQEEKEREILAEKQAALQRKRDEMKLAKQVIYCR
jgi:deoxycytidylate deaminase